MQCKPKLRLPANETPSTKGRKPEEKKAKGKGKSEIKRIEISNYVDLTSEISPDQRVLRPRSKDRVSGVLGICRKEEEAEVVVLSAEIEGCMARPPR